MNEAFRIVTDIINAFHNGVESENNEREAIDSAMFWLMNTPNSVKVLANWTNLNSLRKDFERFAVISYESIPKFPQLTESDLQIIGLGSYQLSQTES